MCMAGDGNQYRIAYHAGARLAFDEVMKHLLQTDWTKEQIKALIQGVEERLHSNPNEFGEPLFTVRGTNVKVAVGFVRPLSIEIGIHEATQVVLVRNVVLMNTNHE